MADFTSQFTGQQVEERLINAGDALTKGVQTLTESEQMQARKNLGLYYEEGELSDTLEWDGVIGDKEYIEVDTVKLVRISGIIPTKAQLVGSQLTAIASGEEDTVELTDEMLAETEEAIYFEGPLFVVAKVDGAHLGGMTFPHAGIWSMYVPDMVMVKSIVATSPIFGETTVHKVEPKYLPDAIVLKCECDGTDFTPLFDVDKFNEAFDAFEIVNVILETSITGGEGAGDTLYEKLIAKQIYHDGTRELQTGGSLYIWVEDDEVIIAY